jgi:soluble lytic murein transglycosylase-like protein
MADRRAKVRAALQGAFIAAALLSPAPALADPLDRWTAEIRRASLRFGIPEVWIRQVMRIESGGASLLHGRPIVSRSGAIGLMQLMPGTWHDMRLAFGLGADPHDPADNILAGAAYLRLMYDRFGYPGLFAAYNAGPARYAGFLAGAHGLPNETRSYVAAIAPARLRRAGTTSASPAGLFAVRADVTPAPRNPSPQWPPTGLFVALSGLAAK